MTSAAGPERIRIIDAHVNLGSDLAIPPEYIKEQAENAYHRLSTMGQPVKRDRIYERVHAQYQDHDADRLVKEMDAAGVDESVLIVPDFTHVADAKLTPVELAELHAGILRRHPGRFRVLWGVDPRAGDEGVALFERCVDELGFQGMKLYPLAGYSPSDRRLYPYYEICAARGLPVLSHTGPGWQALDFTYGQPLLLDQASRDFPGVNFIMGHGAVTHVEEAMYLCGYRPNMYVDVSGFVSVLDPDGWQHHLNRVFKLGLNHKIVFGSSWPAFRLSATLAQVVGEFREGSTVFAGIKRSQRKMIMGGTIERLLTGDRLPAGRMGAQ
ncbi:amidohydrolase family protein [Streptomyces sp. NPDC127190]|uniref:amidohydrolase family protein n=1 Tax=unclassified Streptomyces TaxID=2593676 RepID=UPI003633A123